LESNIVVSFHDFGLGNTLDITPKAQTTKEKINWISSKLKTFVLQRAIIKKGKRSLALVAHACNPSYLGCRDQEDGGSKPAPAHSFHDPISKNPSQKRAGGVAQGVGPEFKPQYRKK
jgi:hypothetical protein